MSTGGDLFSAMRISADGMRAQGTRLRVISENLSNAESTGQTPEDLPYRRRVVTFKNMLDRSLGGETVRIGSIKEDPTEFTRQYQPGHPSADEEGYVLFPNVNSLVEMMDMRQAQRSYEANLNVIESARSMLSRTLDLLRG
ncbi:MAG: flagellar basal body rod protein FlgC [Pseudomonadota bacterium]